MYNKIHEKLYRFLRASFTEPDIIYLGSDTYHKLLLETEALRTISLHNDPPHDLYFQGMRVIQVQLNNYISFGFSEGKY
jgi:hypothetical protein